MKVLLASALVALVLEGSARAEAPKSVFPPQIQRSDYDLELYVGPLLLPNRMTALAGATVAMSDAVEGVFSNASSPAVKEPHSLKAFEFEPSFSISAPGAFGGTDFSNRGDKADPRISHATNGFFYANGGLWFQYRDFGTNLSTEFFRYSIETGTGQELAINVVRTHLAVAYAFLHNQVIVGGGARISYAGLVGKGGNVLNMFGAAPVIGLTVKPEMRQWRAGATARAPVTSVPLDASHVTDPDGVRRSGGFVLPSHVVQPWEIEAGIAYQLGPRPLNPPWIDPMEEQAHTNEDPEVLADARRARYLNWPRERLLLLASVVVSGSTDQAVSIDGIVSQQREIVGERPTFSPRFAAEGELIPDLLRVRAGMYFEPSRFADGRTREHFTSGGDLRVFSWNFFGLLPVQTWRINGFLDIAARYQNVGFGFGTWH